jgi:uncharacterized repeat protein (TIGR01451 family)
MRALFAYLVRAAWLAILMLIVGVTQVRPAAAFPGPVAYVGVTMSAAPDPVSPGSTISYYIDIANGGPFGAVGVVLLTQIPQHTTFVSWRDASRSPRAIHVTTPSVGGTGAVVVIIDQLAYPSTCGTCGEVVSFEIVVVVDADAPVPSTISNTAVVTTASVDPEPRDNTCTVTTQVSDPAPVSP